MFIAMNRFKVKLGSEAAFEKIWRERETPYRAGAGLRRISSAPGSDPRRPYAVSTHTSWHTRADFEAWTKSQAFHAAHKTPETTRLSTWGIPSSKASSP